MMYAYFAELYRKLNIKNTMAQQYHRIKEIRSSIDANEFAIQYANIAISDREKTLKECRAQLAKLNSNGQVLSREIEEAEISHMRTE